MIAPRTAGSTLAGARISSCEGARCDAVRASVSVPNSSISTIELRPSSEPAAPIPRTPRAPTRTAGSDDIDPPAYTGGRMDVTGSLGAMLRPENAPYRGVFMAEVGARFIGRRGFGAAVAYSDLSRASLNLDLDFGLGSRPPRSIPDTPPTLTGSAVDLAALYRLRVEGNDRVGLGIDFTAGLSVLDLAWKEGAAGTTCAESFPTTVCIPTLYVSPARPFQDGVRAGPMAGVSLDLRIYVFMIGASLTWRSGFTGSDAMQFFSAGVHIGLGYWR